MPAIDPAHAESIRQAIAHLNAAVAALQADLRAVLEAERRRGVMGVIN